MKRIILILTCAVFFLVACSESNAVTYKEKDGENWKVDKGQLFFSKDNDVDITFDLVYIGQTNIPAGETYTTTLVLDKSIENQEDALGADDDHKLLTHVTIHSTQEYKPEDKRQINATANWSSEISEEDMNHAFLILEYPLDGENHQEVIGLSVEERQ